jgi:flagellar biosynthesis chaperone FliJ
MTSRRIQAALLLASLFLIVGCTDLKPLQAQVDDLRLQLNQLQKETKAAAAGASSAASSSSAATQKAIRQLQLAAQNNEKAITALNNKIDQMFKRPLAKQEAAIPTPNP